MLKVVLWILAILLLVGIAMLNPLIAAGIVINNSIEAKPFSSSQSRIDSKGKQSVSISEFVAVNPGQKVEESDEKAKKANYYKHKMKSGENIGWTANIQNGNYDTMNSFSINFNY